MIADIVTGKTATADVLWLIAAIVFAVAALAVFFPYTRRTETTVTVVPLATVLGYLGLALVALGLLVL